MRLHGHTDVHSGAVRISQLLVGGRLYAFDDKKVVMIATLGRH